MQSKKWLLYIISFKREAIDSIKSFLFFFQIRIQTKDFGTQLPLKALQYLQEKEKETLQFMHVGGIKL